MIKSEVLADDSNRCKRDGDGMEVEVDDCSEQAVEDTRYGGR